MSSQVIKKGGNQYYVIGSAPSGGSGSGGSGSSGTTFVNDIAARNALDNKSGMVFVKDATGDTTVDRGWAIYIHDGEKWIKIIEEESVNGLWGVRNEIKRTVVTKREMSDIVSELRNAIRESSASGPKLENNLAEIDETQPWSEATLVDKLNEVVSAINTLFGRS